jgi:hypothetical protein
METTMTFPKARLVVSAILFLAWLGFLFHLVLETNKVVISKPQFQIAQVVIVVVVRDDGGKPEPAVTVQEVPRGNNKAQLAGQKLHLTDLLACNKDHGYVGPGEYVIPLIQRAGAWQIAPIPRPGYKRPSLANLGTLEIQNPGPSPQPVLERLLEYARQKPREADDLLEPLMPAIATCYLGQAFFGAAPGRILFGNEFQWQRWIDLPRTPLPRRLPIADALALKKELKECGAKVEVNEEEVRIYPWTPEVREQVEDVLATNKR